jgi:hypothetical protein
MATLKNILSLSTIALLVSACGAKSRLGYNYNTQNQTNDYASIMDAGTFAGSLPQLSSAAQSPNFTQPVPTEIAPVPSSPNVSPILNQTSQDFGYLNNCYRNILSQANGYFQSGISANDIFQGAGQRLVQCYNDTIRQRMEQQQALQAYQTYIYQQNYINQMYAAYQMMNQQNANAARFTIGRPPGVR